MQSFSSQKISTTYSADFESAIIWIIGMHDDFFLKNFRFLIFFSQEKLLSAEFLNAFLLWTRIDYNFKDQTEIQMLVLTSAFCFETHNYIFGCEKLQRNV